VTSATEVLFGHGAPTERSFRNQIIGFATLHRIGFNLLAFPAVVSVVALAGGSFNDPRLPTLFIVVLLFFISGNMIDDIVDRERDTSKWPHRPLATGLISTSVVTFYVITLVGIALLIGGLVFNWLFAATWFLVLSLTFVYSRYARDKIGHLTILLPEAFIPVAIWTAISPRTVLTPLLLLIVISLTAGGAAVNIINQAFYINKSACPTRSLRETAFYITSVLIGFVTCTGIFYFAQLPWTFMPILIVLTICALTMVRYVGKQRSPEMAKKAYMTWAALGTLFVLSLGFFYWIK
jgi:4-hydroxybenzoate polyprenyltransferase